MLARSPPRTLGGKTPGPAKGGGSSHSRIAKVWPPKISAEATPSTVESTGCTTPVRESELADPESSSLEKPRYITAVVWPVVLVTIGSLDSFGIRYLTELTLASTSVRAWFGSKFSLMYT